MTQHKHAYLMKLYAEDAMETDKPWERWQYQTSDKSWIDCTSNPVFNNSYQYRRKPKTININGFEVPEPVREPLNDGENYYTIVLGKENSIYCTLWDGGPYDKSRLKRGLIHLTQEAAEIHAKALLSFTQQ